MAIIYSGASATEDGISVEMAEVKVTSRLTERLVAYGLGACIGVCIYDPVMRIGGMAHVVLPERQNAAPSRNRPEQSLGKFADTGVPFLIEEVCRHGATRQNLRAAMAGGAHIFGNPAADGTAVSRLEIGARNARAVFVVLERLKVPILAADVGGSHGRTVTFRISDGGILVRPIGGAERLLTSLGREDNAREKCT
jgi:chemotaxis protein CheD